MGPEVELAEAAAVARAALKKPRIQALRVALTRRMHRGIMFPATNDDVFHSKASLGAFLTTVVKEVAGVNAADAERLLGKVNWDVPRVTGDKSPTKKLLRSWLGKTRNNIHFNLKTVIFRAWAVGSGYSEMGTPPPPNSIKNYLTGRGYLRGEAGRRGVVAAVLAAMGHCNVDPDEKTFPDGKTGDTLISTWLSTLAFVLSKVRYWDCVCCTVARDRVCILRDGDGDSVRESRGTVGVPAKECLLTSTALVSFVSLSWFVLCCVGGRCLGVAVLVRNVCTGWLVFAAVSPSPDSGITRGRLPGGHW